MKNGHDTATAISLTPINETLFSISLRCKKILIIIFALLNPFWRLDKNKALKQLLPATLNLFSSYKEQIEIFFATVAIGVILLGSIFIFLTQLAKYGW